MTRYRITAADQPDGAPPFVLDGVGVDTVYAESEAALELWLAEAEEAGLADVKWVAVGDLELSPDDQQWHDWLHPDSATIRPEDFQSVSDRDGDTFLRCAHYGRGCWWETQFGYEHATVPIAGSSLGELLEAARGHIATDHRAVIDGAAEEKS